MTFKDIQDEILSLRFNSGTRSSAIRWINATEAKVWGSFEWPFKFVKSENIAITSGDITPTMPAAFHRVTRNGFQNDQGGVLRYLEPDVFDSYYTGSSNASTGRPADFTVRNQTIYVGPTPDSNYTFTISYERTLAHFNVSAAVTSGAMSADTDYPLWDATYHYMLVSGAMALGLVLENDPSAAAVDAEFQANLASMADFYLPPDIPQTLQYGADDLGYEFAL